MQDAPTPRRSRPSRLSDNDKKPIEAMNEEKTTSSVRKALDKLNYLACAKDEDIDHFTSMSPSEARSLIALLQISGITAKPTCPNKSGSLQDNLITDAEAFREIVAYADIIYLLQDRGFCLSRSENIPPHDRISTSRSHSILTKYIRHMYITRTANHEEDEQADVEIADSVTNVGYNNIIMTEFNSTTSSEATHSGEPF